MKKVSVTVSIVCDVCGEVESRSDEFFDKPALGRFPLQRRLAEQQAEEFASEPFEGFLQLVPLGHELEEWCNACFHAALNAGREAVEARRESTP
jgi:hypothetical protein